MIRFCSICKECYITDDFISEDGGEMDEIEKYVNCFLHLKRGVSIYGPAPHKLVLLLAVIRGIEQKRIKENKIFPDQALMDDFSRIWNEFVHTSHSRSFLLPFLHLHGDGFWHLVPASGNDKFLNVSSIRSFKDLKKIIQYACFDTKLYQLLEKSETRDSLRRALFSRLNSPAEVMGTESNRTACEKKTPRTEQSCAVALPADNLTQQGPDKKKEFPFPYKGDVVHREYLENIYRFLRTNRKKTFCIPDLLQMKEIQNLCGDYADPGKKVRQIVTAHADETYPYHTRRSTPICFSQKKHGVWSFRPHVKKELPLNSKNSLSYDEWAQALYNYFFPVDKVQKNLHLFLCDGWILCKIWKNNPLLNSDKSYEDIVSDFVKAVLQKIGREPLLEYPLRHSDFHFYHLPFLCLFSLAWQYDTPIHKRMNHYYERLKSLVTWAAEYQKLRTPGITKGAFSEKHNELWRKFNRALVRKQCSIVLPEKQGRPIDYPHMHAVFNKEDSKRLCLYFAMKNIPAVRSMRDAKEIFYAIKRTSNEAGIFKGEYSSVIGNCIREYFMFWKSQYCCRVADPFSIPLVKSHFFTFLGEGSYDKKSKIDSEDAKELYAKLQKYSNFLAAQKFHPQQIFYMNLAFQNWKNNKCQFNWINTSVLTKILNYAQEKTLQTISDQEAKRLFHSFNLPFEWKEWMADDIRQSSTDRSVSRSQLDVFCAWKVLTAHNRLYAVLQVEGADHTFCLSQKGHREIPLTDDAEYFSLENLLYSGFDLKENLLLKNSELGWKRKIPSIFPMDYDPPTIFRLSYQEYMEKIPHGINVGHLESVAAIFPRQFSEQIQRGKIPELEGGMLEFLPEELNGYPVSIIHLTSNKLTWKKEILLTCTASPYLAFQKADVQAETMSIVLTRQGASLPALRNAEAARWTCDNRKISPDKIQNLPLGSHKLVCHLQNGKTLRKEILVIPSGLGMKSCQFAGWSWSYDPANQESRLLRKQLLTAVLQKETREIRCFFEMPEKAFFWWCYRIGGDYKINETLHYPNLASYRDAAEYLKFAPDEPVKFQIYADQTLLNPDEKAMSLQELKEFAEACLSDFFLLGKTLRIQKDQKCLLTAALLPEEGDAFLCHDESFNPGKNSTDHHWKVAKEQNLQALQHKDSCYVKGRWKNTEVYVSSPTFCGWWFIEENQKLHFMERRSFRSLQEFRKCSLSFSQKTGNLSFLCEKETIKDQISSYEELLNVIQCSMKSIRGKTITICNNGIPIADIREVFADYSFEDAREFYFENCMKTPVFILHLTLDSIFFNSVRSKKTSMLHQNLDDFPDPTGSQYFIAIRQTVPRPCSCDEVLNLLQETPSAVVSVFCYEQVTYQVNNLLEELEEREKQCGKTANRTDAAERLRRFQALKQFDLRFFPDECRFADGIQEQSPYRSAQECNEYNFEYFLRNGFENWVDQRNIIMDAFLNFDQANISKLHRFQKNNLNVLCDKCIESGYGGLLASMNSALLRNLDDVTEDLPSSVQKLLSLMEKRGLSNHTLQCLKTLIIGFAALKTPPHDREKRCCLGYFYHDLLFGNLLNSSQKRQIHALYLILADAHITG